MRMLMPWQQLQEFLVVSHTDHELRELAFAAFAESPGVLAAIPGAGASARELAFAILQMIQRRCGAPPTSLWEHLCATRGHRSAEIERLRAEFAGRVSDAIAEPTEPADAVTTVERDASPQDLLRLADRVRALRGEVAGAEALRGPLADLCPGLVNGLARAFTLMTAEHHLVIRATPSLYRGGERLTPLLRLALPVVDEVFRYFPGGRDNHRPGRAAAHVLRFAVERWDRGGGRVAFVADDARWAVEFTL